MSEEEKTVIKMVTISPLDILVPSLAESTLRFPILLRALGVAKSSGRC
jgi:hypothetical protein